MNNRKRLALSMALVMVVLAIILLTCNSRQKYFVKYDVMRYDTVSDEWYVESSNCRSVIASDANDMAYRLYEYESERTTTFVVDSIRINDYSVIRK